MRITKQDLPEPISEAYEKALTALSLPVSGTASQLVVLSGEPVSGTIASDAMQQKAQIGALVSEIDHKFITVESAATFFVLLLDAAALLGVLYVWATINGFASLLLFLATAGLNFGFIGWCRRREQRRRYHPKLLRAVMPLISKTASERMYVLECVLICV